MDGNINYNTIIEIPEHVDVITSSVLKHDAFWDLSGSGEFNVISSPAGENIPSLLEKLSEQHQPTIVITHPQNVSSFLGIFHQITNVLIWHMGTNYWAPTYFITWPQILKGINSARRTLQKNVNLNTHSYINLNSNVYILMRLEDGSTTVWEAYAIYNISLRNTLAIDQNTHRISWVNLNNKIVRRSNFNGAQIRATAGNDRTFTLESQFTKDGKRLKSGSAVYRLWFIKEGLNFSERDIMGKWTGETSQGTVTGSGEQVVKGIADVGIAQTPMTPNKQAHIDFLQPTDEKTLEVFFVQPQACQYRNLYWVAFDQYVWISIVVVWITIIILILFFIWVKSWDGFPEKITVHDSVIWSLSTATQHGWYQRPTSSSVRLLHLISHLLAVVCVTAFTASIVAFLSVKSNPIKSLDALMNASYKLHSNQNTTPVAYAMPILEAQTGYPDEVLLHESLSIPLAESTPKNAVITFAYVFFVMARQSNFTDKTLCHRFYSLPILQAPLRNAMFVKKASPYKEYFNHQIMLMTERGFNYRFKLGYRRGTEASCLDYSTAGRHQPLKYEDVMSASIILGFGSVCSILSLLLEFYVYSSSKHAKKLS